MFEINCLLMFAIRAATAAACFHLNGSTLLGFCVSRSLQIALFLFASDVRLNGTLNPCTESGVYRIIIRCECTTPPTARIHTGTHVMFSFPPYGARHVIPSKHIFHQIISVDIVWHTVLIQCIRARTFSFAILKLLQMFGICIVNAERQ